MGFACKCKYVFCAKHRYAEDHNCTFDYQAKAKDLLIKENPQVKTAKVQKF